MLNFIKSILTGETETPEEKQEKEMLKNFDILKYDGIRAMHVGDITHAEKCFTKALLMQKDTEVMEHLVRLYDVTEQPEKAVAILNELTEIHPESIEYLLYMGNIYYGQKNYSEMIKACQQALAIDNKNAKALYLNAKAYHKQHDDLAAIVSLTQALNEEPEFHQALLLRCSILLEMKQYSEAEKDIETLLENADADKQEVLILKGKIELGKQNTDKAILCFKQIIEENPFNKEAYLILADTYAQTGNIDESIHTYNEAIELLPDFAQAYYERGRIKLQKGDSDGSLADIKTAMEIDPDIEKTISGQFNNAE